VDDAKVVVGVWQDADEPDGVGMYVKGDRKLRTVITEQKTGTFRVAAIPCECYEQAVALKEVAGEPRAHN
jgi:hypothetical protein